MTKKLEVYKCEVCGNIVEVLHEGGGQLVCCGKPMVLQEIKTQEEGKEKHLPVIEKIADGVKVKIGSVPHPMEENHHIEWISIDANGKVLRKFLKPGDAPEAEFKIAETVENARDYCNIHGLWKAEV